MHPPAGAVPQDEAVAQDEAVPHPDAVPAPRRDGDEHPGRRVPGTLRQLASFGGIGAASTLAYTAAFAALAPALGAQGANVAALLLTAIANTAANRRLTFGVRGRRGAGRHQVQGLAVFGLALALTGGGLGLLHAAVDAPGRWLEVVVLTAANVTATVVRFALLRWWVFRP
ncbi:MAG: GtrA family protein [Kineosporiaceae bacterium]